MRAKDNFSRGPRSDSISVADPGCLSRIPDLGSRIQKQQQKRGVTKNFLSYLFLQPQISQIENYLILKTLRKNFGPIFKELYNFLLKKFSLCSQKYRFRIRDPEKTYSGSRIQGSKRHRIPVPDPQHWTLLQAGG